MCLATVEKKTPFSGALMIASTCAGASTTGSGAGCTSTGAFSLLAHALRRRAVVEITSVYFIFILRYCSVDMKVNARYFATHFSAG
jgi:hypothetical protein